MNAVFFLEWRRLRRQWRLLWMLLGYSVVLTLLGSLPRWVYAARSRWGIGGFDFDFGEGVSLNVGNFIVLAHAGFVSLAAGLITARSLASDRECRRIVEMRVTLLTLPHIIAGKLIMGSVTAALLALCIIPLLTIESLILTRNVEILLLSFALFGCALLWGIGFGALAAPLCWRARVAWTAVPLIVSLPLLKFFTVCNVRGECSSLRAQYWADALFSFSDGVYVMPRWLRGVHPSLGAGEASGYVWYLLENPLAALLYAAAFALTACVVSGLLLHWLERRQKT